MPFYQHEAFSSFYFRTQVITALVQATCAGQGHAAAPGVSRATSSSFAIVESPRYSRQPTGTCATAPFWWCPGKPSARDKRSPRWAAPAIHQVLTCISTYGAPVSGSRSIRGRAVAARILRLPCGNTIRRGRPPAATRAPHRSTGPMLSCPSTSRSGSRLLRERARHWRISPVRIDEGLEAVQPLRAHLKIRHELVVSSLCE